MCNKSLIDSVVIDTEFNRENYNSLIGSVVNSNKTNKAIKNTNQIVYSVRC
jgi:hypothetical protein